MTVGDECPECGKRLAGTSCACGWRPSAAAKATRECTLCSKARGVEVLGMAGTYPCEHCGAVSANFCHQCGARSGSTTRYDDGRRLCPTCRLAAVKAIASVVTDLCTECGVPVGVHIAEFREQSKRIAERMVAL
jgi:hypothetical protein